MKTKVVYVLVSQESDYYYEMFLLSHYSLRHYHPKGDVDVVLVMDTDTHQRLVDKKAPILDDITPVVVEIPAEYTIMQRSRYLKTSLRQQVDGDFLYLDCDTLVCNSLDDIDYVDAEIAMVLDSDGKIYTKTSSTYLLCDKAGFPLVDDNPYYNSGVIYAKDTINANRLFETWHQVWNVSLQRCVPQDQPSLYKANLVLGCPIKDLPVIWNNLIKNNSLNTKIFHYYSSRKSYMRSMLFDKIRKLNSMTIFNSIVQNPMTIGMSVFTISDDRFMQYIYSDSLYVFDTIPKLYRIFVFFMTFISKINRYKTILFNELFRLYE